MFISPKTYALMEQNSVLKEQSAALAAENRQLQLRLGLLEQADTERRTQEQNMARQFDSLFAYDGTQKGGTNESE